jgi:Transposase DNA-binding/Transposase Tn5 dimerisation domain
MLPERELTQADLGDTRLNHRLRLLVDAFTAQPTAAIPQACAGMVDLAYRFFDNPNVHAEDIRAAHYADTVARWPTQDEPVLLASDTTWVDYSRHPHARDLGYQQHLGQQGLFLHSTLACTVAGLPLGLLDQIVWVRDPAQFGKRADRNRKGTADKESQRWLDALAACIARRPAGRRILFLADREGDLYDLFAWPRPAGVDLLIRGDGRRRLHGESRLLQEVLADAAVWATGQVEVPRKDGRPGRTAAVELRVQKVRLAVPSSGLRGSRRGPVEVTAVLVREPNPPAGVEPVQWLLLTTLEVADAATAWQVVGYYTRRWRVEQYHFTLKSGCVVERLQLETRARLERALAVYTVVAVRLLRLSYLARVCPQQSCEAEFRRLEWQVLLRQVQRQFGVAVELERSPGLGEVVYWVARLGGYVGRGKKARPGVKVLWCGLRRLHDLVAGYELVHSLHPQPPPTGQTSVE